jgi:Cu/Ag efflux pump CusA
MAHPRTLVPAALVTAGVAAVVAMVFGLPTARGAGFIDIFAIAVLSQIVLRIPIWRSRERAEASAQAELKRAA